MRLCRYREIPPALASVACPIRAFARTAPAAAFWSVASREATSNSVTKEGVAKHGLRKVRLKVSLILEVTSYVSGRVLSLHVAP